MKNRFLIEDLDRNEIRHEPTTERAFAVVRFLADKMGSRNIRMTDHQAGTHTEFHLAPVRLAFELAR